MSQRNKKCEACSYDLRGAKRDRKSTRLNSSHGYISYAVFCLKKKEWPSVPVRHRSPPLGRGPAGAGRRALGPRRAAVTARPEARLRLLRASALGGAHLLVVEA